MAKIAATILAILE